MQFIQYRSNTKPERRICLSLSYMDDSSFEDLAGFM